VHCNGITLVWKTAIDFANQGFDNSHRINDRVGLLEQSIAEAILTPTTIYVQSILHILSKYGPRVRAIANITGEGIHNITRVLPDDTGIELTYPKRTKEHRIFDWVQNNAGVPTREMYEDYNMGVGMAIVVDRRFSQEIIDELNLQRSQSFTAHQLGKVVDDPNKTIIINTPEGETLEYKEE